MTSCNATLDRLNWTDMGLQLDAEGHALLPGLLGAGMARSLVLQVTAPCAHRVALESSDLGRGELFYFGASLPAPLEAWRTALYRRLAVVANRWNKTLGVAHRYPEELEDFLSQDRLQAKNTQKTGQAHAQSYFLISKNLQFSDSNTQCKTLVLVLAVHCEEAQPTRQRRGSPGRLCVTTHGSPRPCGSRDDVTRQSKREERSHGSLRFARDDGLFSPSLRGGVSLRGGAADAAIHCVRDNARFINR